MNITQKRINDLLYERRITQSGLADICGINQPTLSRNLNGVHSMRIELIVKIADYFKVSVDYLLGRSDEKLNDPKIIEKIVTIPNNSKSPFVHEPIYHEVISLVDRLSKDELLMLKGMMMAIIGTDKTQDHKTISDKKYIG